MEDIDFPVDLATKLEDALIKLEDALIRIECLEKRVVSLEDFRSSVFEAEAALEKRRKLEDTIKRAMAGDPKARGELQLLVDVREGEDTFNRVKDTIKKGRVVPYGRKC